MFLYVFTRNTLVLRQHNQDNPSARSIKASVFPAPAFYLVMVRENIARRVCSCSDSVQEWCVVYVGPNGTRFLFLQLLSKGAFEVLKVPSMLCLPPHST